MRKLNILFLGLLPAVCIAHGSCEADHSIRSITDDGAVVVLDDGSIWEISSYDQPTASMWTDGTSIVACDNKLINTDDDESVDATRLK